MSASKSTTSTEYSTRPMISNIQKGALKFAGRGLVSSLRQIGNEGLPESVGTKIDYNTARAQIESQYNQALASLKSRGLSGNLLQTALSNLNQQKQEQLAQLAQKSAESTYGGQKEYLENLFKLTLPFGSTVLKGGKAGTTGSGLAAKVNLGMGYDFGA